MKFRSQAGCDHCVQNGVFCMNLFSNVVLEAMRKEGIPVPADVAQGCALGLTTTFTFRVAEFDDRPDPEGDISLPWIPMSIWYVTNTQRVDGHGRFWGFDEEPMRPERPKTQDFLEGFHEVTVHSLMRSHEDEDLSEEEIDAGLSSQAASKADSIFPTIERDTRKNICPFKVWGKWVTINKSGARLTWRNWHWSFGRTPKDNVSHVIRSRFRWWPRVRTWVHLEGGKKLLIPGLLEMIQAASKYLEHR